MKDKQGESTVDPNEALKGITWYSHNNNNYYLLLQIVRKGINVNYKIIGYKLTNK